MSILLFCWRDHFITCPWYPVLALLLVTVRNTSWKNSRAWDVFISSHNICNDTNGNNIPSHLNYLNDQDPKTTRKYKKAIYGKDSTIPLVLWTSLSSLLHRPPFKLQHNPSIFFNSFFQSQSIGKGKHACLHVPPKNQPNISTSIVNATNPQVSNPTSPIFFFPMHTLTSAISLLDKVSNAFNASFKAGLGFRLYGIGWHQRMVSCEEGIIREDNDTDDDDDDHHHQILEGCWKSWQLEVRDIVPTSY